MCCSGVSASMRLSVFFNARDCARALLGIEFCLNMVRQHEGVVRTNFDAQVAAIAAAALTGKLDLAARNDVTLEGGQPAIHAHGLRSGCGGINQFSCACLVAFAIERGLQFGRYKSIHRQIPPRSTHASDRTSHSGILHTTYCTSGRLVRRRRNAHSVKIRRTTLARAVRANSRGRLSPRPALKLWSRR